MLLFNFILSCVIKISQWQKNGLCLIFVTEIGFLGAVIINHAWETVSRHLGSHCGKGRCL